VEYLKKLGVNKSIYDIIKEMEMPYEWLGVLADYCKKKKLLFLSTPFDEQSADILEKYVPAFKIASYEITHLPLIEYIAKKGKPMIISTGAANMGEIDEAVDTVYKAGNPQLCLMQCTAKYPSPLEAINTRVFRPLKDRFGVPVGLSDHSREALPAPIAAVSLGANLVEKHFTISNSMPGPDHTFALEPDELENMVQQIRMAERALGSFEKKLLPEESELVNYRRAIFTRGEIRKGEIFSSKNLIILRKPGLKEGGVAPKEMRRLIGKKAKLDLTSELLLQPDDVIW